MTKYRHSRMSQLASTISRSVCLCDLCVITVYCYYVTMANKQATRQLLELRTLLIQLYVDEKKTVRQTRASLEVLGHVFAVGSVQRALRLLEILRSTSEAGRLRPKVKRLFPRRRQLRNCRACLQPFMSRSKKELFCTTCAPDDTAQRYLYTYGITAKQAKDLLDKQGNKCALCPTSFDDIPSHRRHIDHDHKTGKIRGWVCGKCNTRLVGVEDTSWLERAVAYLKQEGITPTVTGYVMINPPSYQRHKQRKINLHRKRLDSP
jgi:hypothetical protein